MFLNRGEEMPHSYNRQLVNWEWREGGDGFCELSEVPEVTHSGLPIGCDFLVLFIYLKIHNFIFFLKQLGNVSL